MPKQAVRMFWCDPEAHGGEQAPAEFVLRIPERKIYIHRPSLFACCAEHIGAAYDTLDPTTEETVTLERLGPDGV